MPKVEYSATVRPEYGALSPAFRQHVEHTNIFHEEGACAKKETDRGQPGRRKTQF